MNSPIILGPLLGFEDGDFYTVCVLLQEGSGAPVLELSGLSGGQQLQSRAKVERVDHVGACEFWRIEFPYPAPVTGGFVDYALKIDGVSLADRHRRSRWQFYVPSRNEEPLIAYASCNGFSSAKLARDTNHPYALWEEMAAQHAVKPYSLLLMGGDQVYADELWDAKRCPSLKKWCDLSWKKQAEAKVTAAQRKEIAAFYDWLYTERWSNEHMSLMLASVPSVMMWDDHDIFDGWGSYPKERQQCEVFKEAFANAARVFDVFQLRCGTRNRLNPKAGHRTLRLKFRNYHILSLDNRSERTMKQIMSEENWTDVKAWLKELEGQSIPNLLVMAGVPVVYRSFSTIESIMETTPWHEEVEDDVYDHWSARIHQGEKMRLIMVLLKFLEQPAQKQCKGVILSGDVHVGALGQIWNAHKRLGLTQVISSGIVHPPPSGFAWAGIQLMTSDGPEQLGDGEVATEMLTPLASPRYLRTRNFATLQTGSDGKIWVNWVCENGKWKPSFAIS